ncbi:hypothetical protein OTU49_002895 [Cherax quadricarinatus]|uniref:Uncharacterized protein n=1 Tax=Cherax quadricarinatus TaxID=27406 RepID=A0AAW0X901_CHEQU
MQHVRGAWTLLVLVALVQLVVSQEEVTPDHSDDKRVGWSSMHGTWGKRPDLEDTQLEVAEDKRTNWNKFQGSWGKRGDDLADAELQAAEDKRTNWNKFQGSWGKRGDDFTDADLQDAALDKRTNWNKFQGSWGKRGDWSSLQGTWGKRAWKNLQGAWGKRSQNDAADDDFYNDAATQEGDLVSDEAQDISSMALARMMASAVPQKRGWTLWGKRPVNTRVSPRSTNWSSLRGTWGKRSADWNKLRGAWGKRADWDQFRGSWGKRVPGALSEATPQA